MNVKWIKLSTDLFDNRKIKALENLPDGDALIVIWLKLLILAGNVNDGGYVYFTKDIPYTDQLLSTQFNRPLATVQVALQTFQQFGMIEIVDDVIYVSNWEKYQNTDGLEKIREQGRKRVAEYRERKRLEQCNVTVTLPVTQCNGIEKNKKEEGDIDKSKKDKKDAIDGFTSDEELKQLLREFVKMRKDMKKPMTDRAVTMLLNKLTELSKDVQTQKKILEQSIFRGWLSVFPLEQKHKAKQNQTNIYSSDASYDINDFTSRAIGLRPEDRESDEEPVYTGTVEPDDDPWAAALKNAIGLRED